MMMAEGTPEDSLSRYYDALLDICDRLEDVADDLPDRVHTGRCAVLADEIVEILAVTHELEESVLLPRLASSPRAELQHLAERLRREHHFDTDAAIEVQDVLLALAARQPLLAAETMGYLLRSFFESVRRHVRTEQDLLVLLADIAPEGRSLH